MLGYINASQVGNILHLDTTCCIQENTAQTLILFKFEKIFQEEVFLGVVSNNVLIQEAIN